MPDFKVVHLTSAHPRYDTRIFIKMCSSLIKSNYDTTLIVADGKGEELLNGVKIVDVGIESGGRIQRMTKSVSKVFKKALELDADLYHLHDPELMLIAIKLRKQGKKVVFDAHEDLPLQVLNKPYLNKFIAKLISSTVSIYESYVCKRIDAVVTATPFIRDKFLNINTNTVDVNNFPILSELSTLDTSNFHKRKNCCYVGGITKVRGIEEILLSLELLEDPIKLHLAGAFSEKSLEDTVKQHSSWNKVIEHGWLNREGISSIFIDSFAGLVTLHPIINYQDSLPVKMFEYMAAGIPVIYSNIPLWETIIKKEQCGISVDPYSPVDIGNAINYLASNLNEAKLMGDKGRQAVLEKYNWAIEEKKLLGLYQRLLS